LESFEDHCRFLRDRPRYQSLFSLNRSDYRGWAYGLKRAGYATNPVYAQSLINIIETYQLYQYDKAKDYDRFMVHHSGENSSVVLDKSAPNVTTARNGDTFKSLGKELDLSYRKLAKYNERDKHDRLVPGEFIWLKKKRKKAPKNFKDRLYYVRKSESLYDIAQKYGIRLKSLVEKNEKIAERGLRIGDEVRLY